MDDTISYLNTDLDLTSADDLTALAACFEANGVFVLHCDRAEDGRSFATFEVLHCCEPDRLPESDIATMLATIESLAQPLRNIWTSCMLREFNIGYDCGSKPWAFNQGLSSELLGRIAAARASLRITLYRPDKAAEPD